jgi:hypothetical protein
MTLLRISVLIALMTCAGAVELHPRAFELVLGWLSDPAAPVASELNVTAIQKDTNRFPHVGVWERDGWIGADVEAGWIKYKIIFDKDDVVEYLVSENGGGNGNFYISVTCTRSQRTITIEGTPTPVVVLTVNKIAVAH